MDTDTTRTLKEAVTELLISSPEDDAPSLLSKLILEFPNATTKQVKNVAQRVRKSEGLGCAKSSLAPIAQKRPADSLPASSIRITDVPGKGKGVIATKAFEMGEIIVAETPVISLTPLERRQLELSTSTPCKLEQQFQQLTSDDQDKVMDLHDSHMEGARKTLNGIVKTNAFRAGGDAGDAACSNLFLGISRFNCSCSPNAGSVWRGSEARQVVYATRLINEGEEVCISYMGSGHARTEVRRQVLLNRYGYVCKCSACENTTPASDARRDRISVLEQRIEGSQPVMPQEFLAVVLELLDLYEKEGLLTPATLGRLSDEAMETCAILRKPRLTTLKWASQALENYAIVYGDDDVATQRAAKYVQNCEDQSKYNRLVKQVIEQQSVQC